jgi:hypothetical protein
MKVYSVEKAIWYDTKSAMIGDILGGGQSAKKEKDKRHHLLAMVGVHHLQSPMYLSPVQIRPFSMHSMYIGIYLPLLHLQSPPTLKTVGQLI